MIIDTSHIYSSIKRYKAQLRYYKDKLDANDMLVKIEINKSFIIDVGIDSSLVEIMSAEDIVESVNRAGSNWVKLAYCAQLMLICDMDADKAEEISDICYANLDEDVRDEDFFDIDCEF